MSAEINEVIVCNEKNTNSDNSFTLVKTNSFYNPFSICVPVTHKWRAVSDIIFYDKEGIKAKTGRGWFGSNNNIKDVTFITAKPLVRKTTIKFDTKAPFVVKGTFESYDVYIPISDLPKFEISYAKECKMIAKYTDIGLPFPSINYIRETAKYFSGILETKCIFDEALKSDEITYSLTKSDEEFEAALQKLRNIRDQYKFEVDYEKNYTVEDYLEEIKG